jgi:transcriptional regulator with XRE-family HTH domain
MPRLILAKALKKRKLSKRQFAKQLDMEYRFVFRYFRVDYNPTFRMLCRWAKAIPCRVRDLIEE